MQISNEKENLPNKLFRTCNGHSKYCFEIDFGLRHSFCVPQPWMDPISMFVILVWGYQVSNFSWMDGIVECKGLRSIVILGVIRSSVKRIP